MTDTIRTANAITSSRRSRMQPRVLEPRVLLDAAAVETVVAVAEAPDDAMAVVDAAELFDAPAVSGRREAFVVDTSVAGYEGLLGQIPDGAELYLIDSGQPGLAQLNGLLAGAGQFDTIHIVSHGEPGVIHLGADRISQGSLPALTSALHELGSHLTAQGDILFYGCDVAAFTDGVTLLEQLADITGADVAASSDATGGVFGDLVMEAWAGTDGIQADPWSAVAALDVPLALDGFYSGREDGDATTADQLGYTVDADGEWVVAGGNGNKEVQVWRVVGVTRTEQKIDAPAGTSASFGQAVSISGNTMVVGDPGAGTSGRVYVYQLNEGTMLWELKRTLDINTEISGWGTSRVGRWANDSYGSNQWLAVSGNHIAVGAPNEGSSSGRVAWFADASINGDWSGTLGNTFLKSGYFDEITSDLTTDDDTSQRHGASVAIDGGVLVVGAPGADATDDFFSGAGNHGVVRIYGWSEGATDAPSRIKTIFGNPENGSGGNVARDAYFGAAVDVDFYNGVYTIVVGAPGEDSNAGEAYFYQSTNNYALNTNIYNHGTSGDNYGLAVAVSQGRIIVGAPNHTANTERAVFFYEKANNVWTGLDLDASGWGNSGTQSGINYRAFSANVYGGAGDDKFGRGVAFTNGNSIAAGAPQFSTDNRGTVAFFYARTPVAVNDSWTIDENSGAVTFNVKDGTSSTGQDGPDDIYGTEDDTSVLVTPVLPTNFKGILVWNADSNTFTFNPNGQFEYLSQGDSEVIVLGYQLKTTSGGYEFITNATVRITVEGSNDAPVADSGIPSLVVPRVNEPNGNPAGAQTPSTGSVAIPFTAFGDVDQSDVLTYSALSITRVGGTGTATVAPTITPTGNIRVSGSYNKVTGANTGTIVYDLTGLDATYSDTIWRVTVQVSDGKGGTATTTFDFTVARDNQNPETQTIPNMAATEDAVFTYDFESDDNINVFGYFRDPDTTLGTYPERLTYSIVSQSGPGPDWLSISADGVLAGAPSNENVGAHAVKLKVTDIFGNSIESNVFTITVGNTNDAPVLINDIDRKVSIKGETFSFNVKSGALAWGGGGAPNDDVAPAPYGDPNNFFYDIDNSLVDGRAPSSNDVITYRAFNAVDGTEITSLGSGGNAGGANDVSWLAFDGTSFTGTSAGVLGSTITIRLRATDNHGAFTETEFEIGIFPRDGAGLESGAVPTPEYAAQVGYDVAINSGTSASGQGVAGRWAVVGAPGANTGRGYIYIYENTAGPNATPTWTLNNLFTTSAAYARLGTSVAISADGLRIVAGAPNEDTNGATTGSLQGAVYFFQNNGSGVWTAAATPKATAPAADANNGDRFGSAVAINEDGAVVLVGAPMDDEAGTNAGAAYAFNFGTATAGNKLLPLSDAVGESGAGDLFGSSVAFDQNMFVIGSPRDDHSGKVDAGSVYVVSTDSTWSTTTGQIAKLKKSALSVGNYDYFGTSVDVDVFSGPGGARDSVGIVVGTPKDDIAGVDAGAVYVFYSGTMVADNTNGGGLTSIVQLGTAVKAYDAVDLQEFGASVALDVDELTGEIRMAVGSSLNAASSGAVYAYRYWGANGWIGQRYLPATGALKFGHAVDVAASIFIAGAPDSDRTQSESGKYYSFNSRVTTSGQTPIEALSSATPIAKVVDSGQPSPVILSSGQQGGSSGGAGAGASAPSDAGFFLSLLGDDRDDEWKRLLRPVTDWTVGGRDIRFTAAANSPLSPISSYTDAVLFEQRTQADDAVLAAEVTPAVPEEQKEAPVEGEQPPVAEADDAPLAALLKGFSTQLQAANDVRAREARQLLSSLGTLAS